MPSSLLNHSYFVPIGFIVCSYWSLNLIFYIIRKLYFQVRQLLNANVKWDELGKWAVITGGTDGIGKAYAQEFASRGFQICLISRNKEKLNSVAKEISDEYKVETMTINVDFTGGSEIYEEIATCLAEIHEDIGVLVNNVGMSYKYAEYFHEIPNGLEVMNDLIYSNVTSCTMMMRLILPQMEKRKCGVILNISSLLALYPMPLLTTYAACKAYVDSLSRATQYEYKSNGIIIQSVLPGYVATKMSKMKPSLTIPSARTFVSSAMGTIGTEDFTYGYFYHKVRGIVHEWLRANMPARFNLALSLYFMNKIRQRYYKKMGFINS